jgi:hypothetical protein
VGAAWRRILPQIGHKLGRMESQDATPKKFSAHSGVKSYVRNIGGGVSALVLFLQYSGVSVNRFLALLALLAVFAAVLDPIWTAQRTKNWGWRWKSVASACSAAACVWLWFSTHQRVEPTYDASSPKLTGYLDSYPGLGPAKGGGFNIFISMVVANAGAPSIAKEWRCGLCSCQANPPKKTPLEIVGIQQGETQKLTSYLFNGKIVERQLGPDDIIFRRTMKAIPMGDSVSGLLVCHGQFSYDELMASDIEVTFKDALDTTSVLRFAFKSKTKDPGQSGMQTKSVT